MYCTHYMYNTAACNTNTTPPSHHTTTQCTVAQTVFDDNHALMYGGAVVLTLGSTMHMQDSTMQHNRANDEGEWRRGGHEVTGT